MVRRRRTPYLSPQFLRRYYGWEGEEEGDEDENEDEEEEAEEEEEENELRPFYDEEGAYDHLVSKTRADHG